MADHTSVTASDNVIITCNDDSVTDNMNCIRFQKHSTPITLVEMREDGSILVTGTIRRAGIHVFNNTVSGAGEIVQFQKDGTTRLSISHTAEGVVIETPSATDNNIFLKSAGDVIVQLDHDGDTSEDNFKVIDDSSVIRLQLWTDSTYSWVYLFDGSGLYTHIASSDDTALFRIGNGGFVTGTRGSLLVSCDPTTGQERPGIIMLFTTDKTPWYLWVDSNGKLRIHDDDPDTDEFAGSIVGP